MERETPLRTVMQLDAKATRCGRRCAISTFDTLADDFELQRLLRRGCGTLCVAMTRAAKSASMTIDAYLTMEAAATERHILWNGEVFSVEAMAGGTPDHNTICGNVVGSLYGALMHSKCRVMTSDQKVWVPRKSAFVYPDATVVCGALALYPGTTDVVTNPVLLVEVLSESTEKFDRGEKWEGYRAIASLRHYIMVSSQHRLVEHYARADGEAWLLRAYTEGADVRVTGPDLTLSVAALYRMALEGDNGS
jgi:Uma2 family endonuclease